ncbi:26S proteasome non-ATPase regulatory subunit 11 [Gracilariopsis chorda]|uniref:26S proteasome non-ATPase regulatory subunit 11 n=1 Tax=Gracilariopsis chorda TaxID=448386 RepID=A0A2V3IJQ5_9FLOR|nr:26S proteasome non-ATPase regulatory subunit 11 [Gracilariopsis chorda]|eukprot:PXF42278.1 26S proteasome non-ATPase regulatory subunit 11 [Gracilariopsis chorda]
MPAAVDDVDVAMADISEDAPLAQMMAKADACADPTVAEAQYRQIINFKLSPTDPAQTAEEDIAKIKEAAIFKLANLLVSTGNAQHLSQLLKTLRPFFATVAKAKTAKIVRGLLDAVAKAQDAADLQFSLCKETIQWCRDEKRTFLRQRVEGRLAALYLENSRFNDALKIINELLREVKRLDDKAHLLEIQLTESRIHHALRNIPKARAALTSARTTANAIYVPLTLQAQIDMQAGIIAAEEKDYKTAYSYFYEGFEGYMSLEDPRAVSNLKYMLLCKIMTGNAQDVPGIVNGSVALKYSGREVDAMLAVAKAHSERSLESFEKTLKDFKTELSDDPIVQAHLSSLYDTLKEQNLLRLIEPFSRVEIQHVAKLINLDLHDVESKLSQMILDKKLNGILDQGAGCLVVYDNMPLSKTYQASLDTMVNMDSVVTSLFEKASTLR